MRLLEEIQLNDAGGMFLGDAFGVVLVDVNNGKAVELNIFFVGQKIVD
jgi:hypothetical protein